MTEPDGPKDLIHHCEYVLEKKIADKYSRMYVRTTRHEILELRLGVQYVGASIHVQIFSTFEYLLAEIGRLIFEEGYQVAGGTLAEGTTLRLKDAHDTYPD